MTKCRDTSVSSQRVLSRSYSWGYLHLDLMLSLQYKHGKCVFVLSDALHISPDTPIPGNDTHLQCSHQYLITVCALLLLEWIKISVVDNNCINSTVCSCASASISLLHGCCTDTLPPDVTVNGENNVLKLYNYEEKKQSAIIKTKGQ